MKPDELLDLKDEIEKAKQDLSEFKGQQKALMTQLKSEWGCISIEQAEKKLSDMDDELALLDSQIEKGIKEIEEKYPVRK
jgi:chromosome segregation ATPase